MHGVIDLLRFLFIGDVEAEFHLNELQHDEHRNEQERIALRKIEPQEMRIERPRDVGKRRVEKVLRERQMMRVADHMEEPDEDWELEQNWEARLERIDLFLLPNLHDFGVHLLRVICVLFARSLDFWLQELHFLLSLQRVLRRNEEDDFHEQRENQNRPTEVVTRQERCDADENVEERTGDDRVIELSEQSCFSHNRLRRERTDWLHNTA